MGHAVLLVGMHPDRSEDIGVGLGQPDHLRQLLDRDADAQHVSDAGVAGVLQDLREVVAKLREVEVAVRVGERRRHHIVWVVCRGQLAGQQRSILLRAVPESFSLNWMPTPAARLPWAPGGVTTRHDRRPGSFLVVHEREQHENLVADLVVLLLGTKMPPPFTYGMYEAYSALLSLMVRDNTPGRTG